MAKVTVLFKRLSMPRALATMPSVVGSDCACKILKFLRILDGRYDGCRCEAMAHGVAARLQFSILR
jgi:hypothetical protein